MSRNARFARFAVLTLLMSACGGEAPVASRPSNPAIGGYFDLVRGTFSGENAFQTVAALDKTFRVPGNEGFNAAIHRVVDILEGAGYMEETEAAPDAPLTYRIEVRPMEEPTWEPVGGSLDLVGETDEALLRLDSNFNMIAINSYSTPAEGVEAEVVYVGDGRPEQFEGIDVTGKIVFGETSVRRLFSEAVQNRGALGVLSYSMPEFNRPEINTTSIQFSGIPLDADRKSWGLRLSYAVKERLKEALHAGPVRARVTLDTRIYPSEELTLVADVHGQSQPDERLVLSAHVQEPGANDNLTGVAVEAEVARVLGTLVGDGRFTPDRTISMLWGDEIISTRRYVQEDEARASGILWGISLDMVGEDTQKTGGTFLIEKMPDPSTIWARGEDQHTAWWGDGRSSLTEEDLRPHYLNDFILGRCLDQAAATGWVVKTNPFEGGSDHVPFLNGNIPGLLLWHFTDQFYHTDGDRIDKVSAETMTNVGVATVVSAMTLTSAGPETARFMIDELERAALTRLASEFDLSRAAIAAGEDRTEQTRILRAWVDWYVEALGTPDDIEVGGVSAETLAAMDEAVARVREAGEDYLTRL